jgi:DNA gyrase subunit B
VTTSEFRTLANSYQDVKGIKGPMVVRTAAMQAEEPAAETDEAQQAAEAEARSAPPAKANANGDVRIESLDDLVEFFIAAGKKGVAINRYKGLGEMNPDTLWETTMDPAKRTLLQVKAEDHTEADLMFTTLMGDQVEPRRKFIEDNALDVKNLDI